MLHEGFHEFVQSKIAGILWDIERILNEPLYSTSLSTYLEFRFGLEVDEKDNALLRELGFDGMHQKIGAKVNKEVLFAFLIANEDRIYENSKLQRSVYKDYLLQLVGNSKKILLVDIGYSGSMQACISELLGRPVEGAYLATSSKAYSAFSLDPTTIHAYLDAFASNKDVTRHLGINSHRFFYETVICSEEDSFEGFEIKGDTAYFKFWEDSGANVRKGFVQLAHSGAVAFAVDLAQRWEAFEDRYFLTPQQSCVFFDSFLKMPPPADIPVFYDVEFEDKFGPDVKRVLCASPSLSARKVRHQEIWKEGVKLKPQIVSQEYIINKAQQSRIDRQVKKVKITSRRVLFCHRFFMSLERLVLKTFLSTRKYRKYHLNRSRFFSDSRHAVTRAYGRMVGVL